MADIPTLDAAPEDAEAKPKGKSKLLMIIIAAVIVLGGAGAGAWYFLSQDTDGKVAKAEKKHPDLPAQYVALDPPFVVNFEASQLVRFLQITVQVMTRELETVELIKSNDPVIRNDLLLLFGNQKYELIATREGKEKLRKDALESIRKIVQQGGGKPESVEAVYFTSFVMQ